MGLLGVSLTANDVPDFLFRHYPEDIEKEALLVVKNHGSSSSKTWNLLKL